MTIRIFMGCDDSLKGRFLSIFNNKNDISSMHQCNAAFGFGLHFLEFRRGILSFDYFVCFFILIENSLRKFPNLSRERFVKSFFISCTFSTVTFLTIFFKSSFKCLHFIMDYLSSLVLKCSSYCAQQS